MVPSVATVLQQQQRCFGSFGSEIGYDIRFGKNITFCLATIFFALLSDKFDFPPGNICKVPPANNRSDSRLLGL